MRTLCFLLFSATLSVQPIAYAGDPHRCDVNGKIIITDVPCSAYGGIDTNPRSRAADTVKSPPSPRPVQRTEQREVPRVSIPPTPIQIKPTVVIPPPQIPTIGISAAFIKAMLKPPMIYLWLILAVVLVVRMLSSSSKQSQRSRCPERRRSDSNTTYSEPSLRTPLEDESLPYKSSDVMTRYELEFFQLLKNSLPECEVFPQVPLAAIIEIDRNRAGPDYHKNRSRWQARISQQRVDYLICSASSMTILAAVELDDPSHDKEEAQARDNKKDKSLAEANIPIVRWRVESLPAAQEIRRAVLQEASKSA